MKNRLSHDLQVFENRFKEIIKKVDRFLTQLKRLYLAVVKNCSTFAQKSRIIMILFFKTSTESIIATEINHQPNQEEINELCWLYGNATCLEADTIDGFYVGPRREMVTPWSTNAVEITQNIKSFNSSFSTQAIRR